MERFVLASALVLIGTPLWIFGWAVARRRFDLVFGDFSAETTVVAAWDNAHQDAGRDFQRLGGLLTCSGPVVFLVGFPVGGWLFGALMVLLVVGVCLIALRALSQVQDGQLSR
jgi:hypothetical protein